MDPFSALSLAGTIMQFVDFGSKLLKSSVQLYKSSRGSLDAHEELELVIGDLQSVVVKLRRCHSTVPEETTHPITEEAQSDGDGFHEICDQTANVAEELLEGLKRLRVKTGGNHLINSLKAAVKAVWSKDEIRELVERLSVLKESLQSRSLLSIQHQIDTSITRSSAQFDILDKETRQILAAMIGIREDVSAPIVETLARMTSRLEALNQDEHHKTRDRIANHINAAMSEAMSHSHFNDLTTITANIEMLSVSSGTEKALRRSVKHRILDELSYQSMTSRYEDVVEAHPKTFDWVFSDTRQWQLPWSDFREWLQKGSGIYWINGKPGSGKSTLMKHIYDSRMTKDFLCNWRESKFSAPLPFYMATFFFWNSGTDLQQSQSGLLRTLLHQVLQEYPILIPVILPRRWTEAYSEALDDGEDSLSRSRQWNIRELQEAFERLILQKQLPLKLCFFIDGLDEFRGDIEQLCLFFKRISSISEDAKFCLSSRPWVEFQDALSAFPNLKLQNFTAKDIDIYINGKLNDSPAFLKLTSRDEMLASSLTREISKRAEGVFLWVHVVVKLLLKGVNNRDTIPQLWQRLKSFPRELNPLYNTLLSQIEPCYLEWASKAFTIMSLSTDLSSDPFKKLSLSFWQSGASQEDNLSEGVHPITLSELLFALTEDHELEGCESVSAKYEDIQFHLTARCAGLLEVSNCKAFDSDSYEEESCALKNVRWMHRTARDFISKDTKWVKILADISPPTFSGHFALMRASIKSLSMFMKQTGQVALPKQHRGWGVNAWIYAYHATGHRDTRKQRTELLKTLMHMRAPVLDLQYFPVTKQSFLHLATMHCLFEFVEDLLAAEDKICQRQTARTLVNCLRVKFYIASPQFPFATASMANSLIRLGRFPPRQIGKKYEEDIQLRMSTCTVLEIHPLEISRFLESQLAMIETFLNAGVDPTNNLSYIPSGFVLNKNTLQDVVERRLPKDCGDVNVVLEALEEAIRDEIYAQQSGSGQGGKLKRKLIEIISDHETVSNQSEDEVLLLEERPVHRDKRVKFREDD